MIKIKPVPIIAIIVPIQAPIDGIFLVIIQRRNNIIIGLVEDRVATIPASAFCRAISNKLIPKAIPRNPLIIVLIIIKISKRSTLEEFNKSLDNISSIDILGKINNRQ